MTLTCPSNVFTSPFTCTMQLVKQNIDPITYVIDFGEGTVKTYTDTNTLTTVTHSYCVPGTYTVKASISGTGILLTQTIISTYDS